VLDHKKAVRYLSKDPILEKLIKTHGELKLDGEVNLLSDIIESIVNQQLSEKAGATIWGRFKALYNSKTFPDPKKVLKTSDEKIRGCGLSYSKIKYIKGVCEAVIKNEISLERLGEQTDGEVISELIKLKGIGKWTAEMILMFSLKRPDVFSLGDLGLRTAVSKLYKVDRDNIKKIESISLKWSPYRTIAARYLWKSLG